MTEQIYNTNDLMLEMKEKLINTPLITKMIFWITSVLFILHLVLNISK